MFCVKCGKEGETFDGLCIECAIAQAAGYVSEAVVIGGAKHAQAVIM